MSNFANTYASLYSVHLIHFELRSDEGLSQVAVA